MVDSRHIENRLLIISTIYCPINATFGTKKHNHVRIQVTWPKYQISKIQDGGRPPFWKWFYRNISAGNHLNSMKFGVRTHTLIPRTVILTKYRNFANSKWRTDAIFKIVLAKSQRFIVRLARNTARRSTVTFRLRSCDQNAKFRKIKMADGRHFENGFVAISQPRIIRFQWSSQILVPRTVMWQSIKILQIQMA